MSEDHKSLVDRVSAYLIDHVAPRLPAGRPGRGEPTRTQLEAEARAELEARLALGRPGPEEAGRRRPPPEWARPRLRPHRRVDVAVVRLDALGVAGEVPAPRTKRGAEVLGRQG